MHERTLNRNMSGTKCQVIIPHHSPQSFSLARIPYYSFLWRGDTQYNAL